MDLGFEDAHVVFVGASRGIGRAARKFAAEGGKRDEVIDSYFARTGMDPTSATDAPKGQNQMFGDGRGGLVWLDRLGYADDYGDAICSIGSRADSYMTGADIFVDGSLG